MQKIKWKKLGEIIFILFLFFNLKSLFPSEVNGNTIWLFNPTKERGIVFYCVFKKTKNKNKLHNTVLYKTYNKFIIINVIKRESHY